MMLLRQTGLEEADRLRGKSDEMASPLRDGRGKKVKVPICHASSTERWCKRSATAWKLTAVGQYLWLAWQTASPVPSLQTSVAGKA